ncbi:trypsin-like peptidase domain-containing protein [Corallococcus exiguus]|uniref:trypsin-like serine peptidase n=1 Tax=Corallococcus exiguus TaxID=83462 RepID=UPI001A906291|nr:serine protease [Corallococcus exiguus]MBN8471198.1 trypsin-like peptidase domain-containing protein [Corallococcus exiguus]
MQLALTPQERTELASILSAELEGPKLRALIEMWFKQSLDVIAPGASEESGPGVLLDWVTLNGATAKLIAYLLRDAPKTPRLMQFLSRLGTQAADASPLQSLITYNGPMAPWTVFSAQMQKRGQQICRIEVEANAMGTGVLIAPDRVLTAYHVIATCFDAEGAPLPSVGEKIRCRFDYVALADGTELLPGTAVALRDDWLGPMSPGHPEDGIVLELPNPPDCLTLLDYAVLNLAKPVGRAPVGTGGGQERGWVEFPAGSSTTMTLEPDQPLVIGQHPAGHALHIAFGPFKAMDTRQARLRYAVNTMKGASGAPCFDIRFGLVALHHAEVQNQQLNQGVPIWLIRDHIQSKGGFESQDLPGFVPLWQLPSGAPVLGRIEFQQILWTMGAAHSPKRILVVEGDDDSGCSFSIDIMKGLFSGRPDVVMDYDMSAIQDKAPDAFLMDLARDLKLPVEGAPARPVDRQSARWASTLLFDWFTAAFALRYPAEVNGSFSIWIALDNFNRKTFVNDETLDILVRLLREVPHLAALRWLLIGGPPSLLTVLASLVEVDRTRAPGSDEVAEYLARYVEHHGKQTPRTLLSQIAPGLVMMASANKLQDEPFSKALARGVAAFATGLS